MSKELEIQLWLILLVNIIGWAFTLGMIKAQLASIKERLKDGDVKMQRHDEKLETLREELHTLKAEHEILSRTHSGHATHAFALNQGGKIPVEVVGK